MVEGCYPHERGDRAAVEVAQFRQFRHRTGRGFIPPWRVHLDQGLRPRDPMPSILVTWQRWEH